MDGTALVHVAEHEEGGCEGGIAPVAPPPRRGPRSRRACRVPTCRDRESAPHRRAFTSRPRCRAFQCRLDGRMMWFSMGRSFLLFGGDYLGRRHPSSRRRGPVTAVRRRDRADQGCWHGGTKTPCTVHRIDQPSPNFGRSARRPSLTGAILVTLKLPAPARVGVA